MQAFKEQYDFQLDDFTITEQYVEYKERLTKNRQGDDESATKRARKYHNKIWKTERGKQDQYEALTEMSDIVQKVKMAILCGNACAKN